MKRAALMAVLVCFTGWLIGCRRESVEGGPVESELLQLFEKGRGVRLPEDMRQRLGVETAEVAEKLVALRIEKTARVYRAADGSKPGAALALLDEVEVRELRAGQNVQLQADDGPMMAATLAQLDTRSSAGLGQVEAVMEFPDPARRFPAGLFLTATLIGQRSNLVSAIPAAAVVNGVAGPFVYAANGAHFTRTPVKLGATSDGWVEIVDGLYAGDAVVAKAAETLWMIELCALKGGTPCCPAPKKGKEK